MSVITPGKIMSVAVSTKPVRTSKRSALLGGGVVGQLVVGVVVAGVVEAATVSCTCEK